MSKRKTPARPRGDNAAKVGEQVREAPAQPGAKGGAEPSRSQAGDFAGAPMAPADPATPCTCAMLRRTARRATQFYDQLLKPSGLTLSQYSLLANIERVGQPTISELAQRIGMDRTTLSRNLRPAVQAGWIAIVPGRDRRRRRVVLQPEGEQRVAQAPAALEVR